MLARPRTAALAAVACLAGLAITGLLAHAVPLTRGRDAASLDGYVTLGSERLDLDAVGRIAHLADPGPYLAFAAMLVVLALVRRRLRLAALLPVVVVGAPATAETLKPLVAHPRFAEWLGSAQIGSASWPSGHATASMTIALCGVLAAPAVLRPLAAVMGGLYALLVSFSILVLHWHFPSDIVGGYLCAAAWTLGAVAVLRRWPGSPPAPVRWTREHRVLAAAPAFGLAAVAAIAALAAALERPRALVAYLADRPSFAVSAAAIALLAVLLAGVLVHAAREPDPSSDYSCEAPGCQSGSPSGDPTLAPRARMKSRSDSRLR